MVEKMRLAGLLLVASAYGQTWDVRPAASKQGDVIHVTASGSGAVAARMNGKTIRLFPQQDGTLVGLMPVSATYKPGHYKLEFLGEGDAPLYATEVTVSDAHFPEQDVKLRPGIQALQPAPGEMETVAALRNTVSDVRYWSEPFNKPVPGCLVSPFGVRRLHNGKPTGASHGGLDLRGAEGTPVHAFTDGVVRVVREYNVHGNIVGVDHGQGMTSMYLHLSRFGTTEGKKVKAGDVIGYVGTTGRSTAPHLHWTVTVNGVAVNPTQWVAADPCPAAPVKAHPKQKQRRK